MKRKIKINGAALGVKNIFTAQGHGDWVESNSMVINKAIANGLALCGSAGIGVATRRPRKEPKDLDFVTDSLDDAQSFLSSLSVYLSGKKTYYSMMVNHRTSFCPRFVHSHFRFKSPFWKEICVFVLDSSLIKLESFFVDGCRVQNYRQMYDAAEQLEEVDGKARVHTLHDEFEERDEAEMGFCSGLPSDIPKPYPEKQ